MSSPEVSIIISLYNKESFIRETIESIQAQTCGNWELVIVDDCSTDNSLEIVRSYLKHDERIRLFQNDTNKGANHCRNQGIKEAKAAFVIFLDADDLLSPTCLSNRLTVMRAENVDFCVFSMGVFKLKVGDTNRDWIPKSQKPLPDFLSHKLAWTICQPIWRKSFLLSIGGFDTSFSRLQDVELHTRALFNPSVQFRLTGGMPDCFYRIDERRNNFTTNDFLLRVVNSVLQYYNKFKKPAEERNLEKKLLGTIYRIYVKILISYKKKEIGVEEFLQLKTLLFSFSQNSKLSRYKKLLFLMGRIRNLSSFQLPGVNWIIHRLLQT